MITLTVNVENISSVLQVYDVIDFQRSDDGYDGTYTTVSSIQPNPATMVAGTSYYEAIDGDGNSDDWYRSRYRNTSNGLYSSWGEPVLGEPGDIFYDPLFPPEIDYSVDDLRIIEKIRRMIGDPVGLRREYGEDTISSIHPDLRTYELDEKGWPCSIHIPVYDACGENAEMVAKNDSIDPTINGYRFLRFRNNIPDPVTISGIHYGTDIWYYHFRHSDREIMDSYENMPPPPPLTTATANSNVYMLATAIELLEGEYWEDLTEDGAVVRDEGSHYDPSPGLKNKGKMIDALRKKLEDYIKALQMPYIEGVLID